MSLDVVERAASLLPDPLRASMNSALATEALVREGQASLAAYEGAGTRYERVLRRALDDIGQARKDALSAIEAFRRGDISLASTLQLVDAWKDAGGRVLWQRLDEIDSAEAE